MKQALPNGKYISRAGFGCAAIWAKPAFPDGRAQEILETATACGINHFDTAPSYGWGRAETRLGQFLGSHRRDDFVISTKVGTFRGRNGRPIKSMVAAHLEASLTESLSRLGLEQVDILYLHGARPEQLTDEVFGFFEREKNRGRIAFSGLNTFRHDSIRAFSQSPLDVVMLQYNVADLSALDLFDMLRGRGKVIVGGTILAQGITSPATILPWSWPRLWYLARAFRNDPGFLGKGRRLASLLSRHGLRTPEDMARFALADPHVLSGLFSTSRPDHVVKNACAAGQVLEPEAYNALVQELKA